MEGEVQKMKGKNEEKNKLAGGTYTEEEGTGAASVVDGPRREDGHGKLRVCVYGMAGGAEGVWERKESRGACVWDSCGRGDT